jgi:hypothetical protein
MRETDQAVGINAALDPGGQEAIGSGAEQTNPMGKQSQKAGPTG